MYRYAEHTRKLFSTSLCQQNYVYTARFSYDEDRINDKLVVGRRPQPGYAATHGHEAQGLTPY